MAECDAVLQIRDSDRSVRKKRIIIIIIIIITRMLQLQATVKRFLFDLHLNLEGQHMPISS